jgi:hypothetical protein
VGALRVTFNLRNEAGEGHTTIPPN